MRLVVLNLRGGSVRIIHRCAGGMRSRFAVECVLFGDGIAVHLGVLLPPDLLIVGKSRPLLLGKNLRLAGIHASESTAAVLGEAVLDLAADKGALGLELKEKGVETGDGGLGTASRGGFGGRRGRGGEVESLAKLGVLLLEAVDFGQILLFPGVERAFVEVVAELLLRGWRKAGEGDFGAAVGVEDGDAVRLNNGELGIGVSLAVRGRNRAEGIAAFGRIGIKGQVQEEKRE